MSIPPHPGIHLCRLLERYEISRTQLAKHTGLAADRILRIARCELPVTPDVAWLLGQAFNMNPEFWTFAQAEHDLYRTRKELKNEGRWRQIVPLTKPAKPREPSIFDRCVCGHWGWEHIDWPDGGCRAAHDTGEPCGCPLYIRLGGYLAAIRLDSGIADQLKELDYEEERRKNAEQRNDGGVPQLRGNGAGAAEAVSAGDAAAEQARPAPARD